MLEHGSCTGFDTRGEDFPRNVEAEDESRMTRLACPEAAGRLCQAFARSGQLKRTNDAPAVVRVDGLGRARVALDQQGVRSFGPQAVVELLETRSRAE
jgi:aminoglycoside N3'-acetyltransferase